MYFGWKLVVYVGIVYAIVLGSTFSAFGLFVLPVSQELKLSRGDTNTALILLNAGSAVFSPILGRLLDRISARRIMIVSALLAGVSFTTLSFSHSLWLSAFVMGVPLAIMVQGGGVLTGPVLLARWFTAQRGRAMLLAFMGASFGGVAIVPAIGWLLGQEGWRTALLVTGIVVMVLLLTLAFLVREWPLPGEGEGTPRQAAAATPGAAAPRKPKGIGALLAMPQFWTMGLGCASAMAIVQALMISIVPMGMEEGLSALQAAGLVSVSAMTGIATKFLLSLIADRFDRVYLLAMLISVTILINALLLAFSGYAVLFACAILLGFSSSTMSPLLQALLADRFGVASFGSVRGLTAPLISILGAVAVRVSGDVFDRFGHYKPLFTGFMVLGVVAILLMLATKFTRPVADA